MAYRFRLYLESGDDIGTFHVGTLDWKPGDEFRSDDGNRYRVTNLLPFEDDLRFVGALVVTPLELAEPA